MKKILVGLVFGGKSGEHEVSVRSAKSIYEVLDKNKYEVDLLGVDKMGGCHRVHKKWLPVGTEMKSLPSGEKSLVIQNEKIDVFFPIIHGTYGEDGCLQGLLELMNVPYVGAGVLGSAVGMDKDVQKRLLIQAGIKVAKFQVIKRLSDLSFDFAQDLRFPVFVKPANGGSSVGTSKCKCKSQIKSAIKYAFQFDTKVLIEEAVEGRELEVSVLGNPSTGSGQVLASVPGEVIPQGKHEFYDYEAKYIDEKGALLVIPAVITKKQIAMTKKFAIKTYKILECEGMARVDMFLRPNGELVINEINTLPGFTSISMYPKLWEASGLSYEKLLDRLIELAIERHKKREKSY